MTGAKIDKKCFIAGQNFPIMEMVYISVVAQVEKVEVYKLNGVYICKRRRRLTAGD